jgi:hypothetical protein
VQPIRRGVDQDHGIGVPVGAAPADA